jgi:hypothetical protein
VGYSGPADQHRSRGSKVNSLGDGEHGEDVAPEGALDIVKLSDQC